MRELFDDAEKADVAILGVVRDGKRQYGTAQNTTLKAEDALVLEATPDALDEFRAALSLNFAENKRESRLRAEGEGLTVIEVVATEQSRITGKTAQSVGLSWRQRSVVMGISRRGKAIKSQLRKTPVEVGDILLLLVPQERADDVTEWLGCLPLAARGLAVTEDKKVWLAIGLFAAAVLAASFGLIYLCLLYTSPSPGDS